MTIERATFRDYLKQNGIPIRYDLKTMEGIQASRNAQLNYYESIYGNLSLAATDKCLEIGCHYGGFVKFLNSKGITPDAVDLDAKKIEILQKDTELKGNFMCGDALDLLQGKRETYDYVFMNFVLEHIPVHQVLTLLATIQKSIKAGGKLVVTVPNMENPFNLRLRYMEPTHTNGFTTESLIWYFYRSGFDDILCSDLYQYSKQKRRWLEWAFRLAADFMEIRKFHNKFSEALLCQGTKRFNLDELDFGPYDL